ncbi:MAG: glycosyltransferase [Bacteroidia bacterium]
MAIIANAYKKKLENTDFKNEAISIIIPYRNEENNLEKCLKSLITQKFNAHFEIILVNDNSEDNGEKIARDFLEKNQFSNVQCVHSSPTIFGKKNAVLEGVKHAKYPIICTFDADSIASEDWLDAVSKAFQSDKTKMVLGEVIIKRTDGFLNLLQHSESVLTSIFMASGVKSKRPLLVSAANMAFRKEIFNELNPYQDNLHVPSGDDIFLMEKALQKYGTRAFGFIENEVCTNQVDSFEYYFRQRVRWLRKMKYAKGLKLTNALSFFIAFVNTFCLTAIFFLPNLLQVLMLFSIKYVADIFLLSASKHTSKNAIIYSPILFIWWLVYPMLLFIFSFFLKNAWKGREAKV